MLLNYFYMQQNYFNIIIYDYTLLFYHKYYSRNFFYTIIIAFNCEYRITSMQSNELIINRRREREKNPRFYKLYLIQPRQVSEREIYMFLHATVDG